MRRTLRSGSFVLLITALFFSALVLGWAAEPVLVDELHDFSLVFKYDGFKLSNWKPEGSPWDEVEGDQWRVERTDADKAGTLIYKVEGLSAFEMQAFRNGADEPPLSFAVSEDGQKWTKISKVNKIFGKDLGGWWFFNTYSAEGLSGNYLRIQVGTDKPTWAFRIARVKIWAGAPAVAGGTPPQTGEVKTFKDNLDDWSLVHSHEGLHFTDYKPEIFENDPKRVEREKDNEPGWLVYHVAGLTSFEVRAYLNGTDLEYPVNFFVSKDGKNWTKVKAAREVGKDLGGWWFPAVYRAGELSGDYLKIEIGVKNQYWSCQIGTVVIRSGEAPPAPKEIPGSFTLVEPANLSMEVPLRPSFAWNAAPKAKSYTLQIARDEEFNQMVLEVPDLTTNSYKLPEELDEGRRYYWRVTAVGKDGSTEEAEGAPWWFATIGPAVKKAVVTVDVKKQLQTIDGFGVSASWRARAIRNLPEPDRTKFLDWIFSPENGAGLSILRLRIPPEFMPAKDQWKPEVLADDVWLCQEARKRGVRWIIAVPWSPPAWMKDNNNVNNGGQVKPECYPDFAVFLSRYAQEMAAAGAQVDAISLQNEPDYVATYESCIWNYMDAIEFITKYWAPRWEADKRTELPAWGEQMNWDKAEAAINAILTDQAAAGFLKMVTTHAYSGLVTGPLLKPQHPRLRTWVTEVSNLKQDDPTMDDGLMWANFIRKCLYDGGVNAFLYWWIYQSYSSGTKPTGEGLINLESTGEGMALHDPRRLWTIGQYARFVRPGWRLLGVSSSASQIGVAAFVDPAGEKIAVVIMNNSYATAKGVQVKLAGATVMSQASRWQTTEKDGLAALSALKATKSGVTLDLAPRSVTTVVLTLAG
ncbi:MAG: hypothetical protein GX493_05790 [Firmicutes bacterium]|nr:hypothetical protein [Bacillota bacterium]